MDLSPDYERDRVYEAYYHEVGQHEVLSAAQERVLLQRYHTCPSCNKRIPPKVRQENCPKCGSYELKVKRGKPVTCSSCKTVYAPAVIPVHCPRCGSPRDQEARERLIVSNLRFVVKRAAKIAGNKKSAMRTLISAGNVGLVLAIDRFSLNRNTRFLTYADWWIRKEMFDAINASPLIHVPIHKQKTILREQAEGKYVCVHCGCRTDNTHDIQLLPICTNKQHEFQIPLNDKSHLLSTPAAIDDCVVTSDGNVEEEAMDTDMKRALRSTLQNMEIGDRDRYILMGYFNAPEEDRQSAAKNLHQLAAVTGVTPERVRQIKEMTLNKLRTALKREDIEGMDCVC